MRHNAKVNVQVHTGCSFARYCSRACQREHWASGHKNACNRLKHDEFEYDKMKVGFCVYYGPLSHCDFELIRHNALTMTKVNCTPYVDLSVPHKFTGV